MVKEVEFFGQWVTPQGTSLLKEKLKAVRSWDRPQTVKGVRSFLGFTNYYRRFISKYAEIAAPSNVFDEERCRDAMGSSSATGVQAVKGRPVRCADANLPGS